MESLLCVVIKLEEEKKVHKRCSVENLCAEGNRMKTIDAFVVACMCVDQ